jgi:hypothetical protein
MPSDQRENFPFPKEEDQGSEICESKKRTARSSPEVKQKIEL